MTPTITNVTVTPDEDGWHVKSEWSAPALDRTDATGFLLRNHRTAERLATAIRAGAVFVEAEVKRDVNGKTYVAARSLVMAKYANADLNRLGY